MSLMSAKPEANWNKHWLVVSKREITDLWLGGKAILFLMVYSVYMGVMTFLLATNGELMLIPPKEMVYLLLQTTIGLSALLSLAIGADSVSGERDRQTLEVLLLTPVSRRQFIFGKYLMSLSIWPITMILAAGYLYAVAPTTEIFVKSVLWGFLMGSVLVASFSAFGMIISIKSSSNKSSLSASLFIFFILVGLTQLPGTAQTGSVGQFIKRINPAESTNHFLEKIIVNNNTPAQMINWVASPLVFFFTMIILLFYRFGPKLNLFGGNVL